MTMNVQASQLCISCLVKPGPTTPEQIAQLCLSALVKNGGTTAQAAQLALSALVKNGGTTAEAAQLMLSILVWSGIVTSPVVFPTLIGLAYTAPKRPTFYNSTAKSGSGYTTNIGYSNTPTWEWDLTFERLEDYSSSSELKKLLGFYLAMRGSLTRFLWQDADDNQVTGQPVGTSDGTTTIWTLQRTYGYGQTGTENVGYINSGVTFNLYVAGTLQSPSTYDVLNTTPMQQQVRFHTAPSTGQAITADFGYYFYVHFKEDTNEWDKFLYQLWELKKLTIESVKG